MIAVGEKLDVSLRLEVVRGGRKEEVALGELLTRPSIVSVYMRNNTGSCDRQVASLANAAPEFDRAGFNVIAISRDTRGSHLKYADKMGVAFTLVSDPEDAFSKSVDAIVEKSMYGRKFFGPARAAYIVKPGGTVSAVIPKVDTADHAAQVREAIARL